MVRTPSCDKSGLRKGTWTPEEDRKLIAYVTRYGSWNWRQLPRFAGLARCGKSCRLRWMNYLRPNLKRGNFTQEEEECIIKLHAKLGNRWSAIAAQLPGRTDNEIKNHWHTSLKKHSPQTNQASPKSKSKVKETTAPEVTPAAAAAAAATTSQISDVTTSTPLSPISSSSELSSSMTSASNDNNLAVEDFGDFAFLEGSLWTEPYLADILQTPSHQQVPLPSNGYGYGYGNGNGSFDELSGNKSSRQIFEDGSLADLEKEFGSLLEEGPMIESSFWNTQPLPPHVADDVSHVPTELLMTSPSDYFSFSPLCGTDLWSATHQQTSNSFLYHHDQHHLSLF